jgi:hypothetical protein
MCYPFACMYVSDVLVKLIQGTNAISSYLRVVVIVFLLVSL